MKRTLAAALIAGALLLGGCSRPQAERAPTPAATEKAAEKPAATEKAAGSESADDVDNLLDQVDKQLDSTDQPPSEQD